MLNLISVIKYNKIELGSRDGFRVYYSKLKNLLSFLGFSFLIILSLVLFYDELDNEYSYVSLTLILLVLFLFWQAALSRMILKKPIFILKENKLYYLFHDKWYDIKQYMFLEESVDKYNWFLSLSMKDKNRKTVLSEKYWRMNYGEEFSAVLKNQIVASVKERRY